MATVFAGRAHESEAGWGRLFGPGHVQNWLTTPNVFGVLADRTIRGEFAWEGGGGDEREHH